MEKDKGKEGGLERKLATFAKDITHPSRQDWIRLVLRDIGAIIQQELSYASPYKDVLSDGLTHRVKQLAKYARNGLADTVNNYKLMFKHPKETKRALKELGKDIASLVYGTVGYITPLSADYSIDK